VKLFNNLTGKKMRKKFFKSQKECAAALDIPISRLRHRYIKVATDNHDVIERHFSRVRKSAPNFEAVKQFKFDTIRKHCFGFVPEKPQIDYPGNAKFPRLVSFANIVNEFAKIKRRHLEGLQEIDFLEVKEEAKELYSFLRWLYGDAGGRPWDK